MTGIRIGVRHNQRQTWQRVLFRSQNLEESKNGVGQNLVVSGDANWFLAQLQPFRLQRSAICGHRASQDGHATWQLLKNRAVVDDEAFNL